MLETGNDVAVFDARGNGDGRFVNTITGDHENRITDYTSIVVIKEKSNETMDDLGGIKIFGKPYCLQGNGIGRSDNAGCEGRGWCEDVCYTLNTIDRPAVVYGISPYDSGAMKSSNPHSGIYEAKTSRTLDLNGGNPACNQGGMIVVTLHGY